MASARRPGDGQAQPRPAGGDARLALLELLEHPRLRRLRQTGPGVAHGEAHPHPRRIVGGRSRGGEPHAAGARQLHRVAGQVEQHLPQPPVVGEDGGRRRGGVDRGGDLEPPRVGAGREQLGDPLDQPFGVGCDGLELEAPRVQPRVVQHVAHQAQEVLARVAQGGEVGALGGVQPCGGQEARHAEHAVERRPDLVAERGQHAPAPRHPRVHRGEQAPAALGQGRRAPAVAAGQGLGQGRRVQGGEGGVGAGDPRPTRPPPAAGPSSAWRRVKASVMARDSAGRRLTAGQAGT